MRRSVIVATVLWIGLANRSVAQPGNALMRISGILIDSAGGKPLPGARILVQGTNVATTADARGRFTVMGAFNPNPVLEIGTTSLDSMKVVHHVTVAGMDSLRPIEIRVPNAAQIASTFCGKTPVGHPGIVYGRVEISGEATPPQSVRVVAEWPGSSVEIRSNPQGIYRLCGVPIDTPVAVQAYLTGMSAAPFPVRVPPIGRLVRVDLALDRATDDGAMLTGQVRDTSRRALAGAVVELPDLAKAMSTDDRGAFRFAGIPAGAQHVSVRRIGFAPVDTEIAFASNQSVELAFALRRIVSLDSVVTTAVTGVMSEFEEHRKTGLGHFVARAELARSEGRSTGAVMAQIPGMKIAMGRAGVAWMTNGRGPRSLRGNDLKTGSAGDVALGAKPACYSQVFVDNLQVYKGLPGETLFDINSISPDRIEGIEVYASPAQTPLKYSTLNSGCGVIVIWTRR